MYIPHDFVKTIKRSCTNFIRNHSFATLASWIDDEPQVTHLPLLLDPTVGAHGKLIGHMAQLIPIGNKRLVNERLRSFMDHMLIFTRLDRRGEFCSDLELRHRSCAGYFKDP